MYIQDLVNVEQAQFWFVNEQKDIVVRCSDENLSARVVEGMLGLIGKTAKDKFDDLVHEPHKSPYYNQTIDTKTELPLIMLPILNSTNDKVTFWLLVSGCCAVCSSKKFFL